MWGGPEYVMNTADDVMQGVLHLWGLCEAYKIIHIYINISGVVLGV